MLAWLPQWCDPEYGPKIARLKQRLPARGERPLFVAVLGSSRTETGLHGKRAEEALSKALGRPVMVFNFGLPGSGPIRELITLRQLLADVGRPDLLLVEVLPPLLGDGGMPPHELSEPVLPASDLRPRELGLVRRCAGGGRPGLRRDWWTAWAVPCYSHRVDILRAVLPDALEGREQVIPLYMDASGWLPFVVGEVPPEVRRRRTRQEQDAYQPTLASFSGGGRPMAALIELLEVCRAEGIRTGLFLMPEAHEFRSWYPPRVWPEVEQFLASLNRRYGVPVLSARDWLDDDNFVDGHHLFPSVVPGFSDRFAREVIAPLLIERRGGRWDTP
jgi:hypothetical protein